MKMKHGFIIVLCLCVFVACSNRKLRPPKKSPCACYDVIIDMEKKV